MDTTSSSRFPIIAPAPTSQLFHRSMSNCALRSFSHEDNDDSGSSATSTTRGRRRFRRVRASPQQQHHHHVGRNQHHNNESPRSQSDVEWIATGMYEVSIRLKEDASRPPQISISDQALYKEYNNHTTTDASQNFENDNDESSISSMSSYGTGDDITTIHAICNKDEAALIEPVAVPVQDDTVTTDLSSEERKDSHVESTLPLHHP